MKYLGKPTNRWGWVRVASLILFASVLLWTLLTVVLRAVGEIPWLVWSGYQNFSLMNGFELAIVPLMAVFAGNWLEEHDARVESEQARQREAEREVTEQRKECLKRVHEVVEAQLQEIGRHDLKHTHGAVEVPELARQRINEIVRAVLPDLDGKGKGDLVHFLFEKGLSGGENLCDYPVVDWKDADLNGAGLRKVHLIGVRLDGANLRGAQMDGAHLAKGCFTGSNLSKAFLRHANLCEANLSGSNLSLARLESANLEGADLRGARTDGAMLVQASLKGCRLDSSLDSAVLVDTILPDGRKATNEKGKEYLKAKEIETLVDRL
jgi:hypothetical protein